MEKAQKTAKGLFALWVVSYLAFSIYISWAEVFRGFDPANFTSGFIFCCWDSPRCIYCP